MSYVCSGKTSIFALRDLTETSADWRRFHGAFMNRLFFARPFVKNHTRCTVFARRNLFSWRRRNTGAGGFQSALPLPNGLHRLVESVHTGRVQILFAKEQRMSGMVSIKERLSYSEKFSRLRNRLNDPEWRRYFALIAIGKAVAVATVLIAIFCVMNYMRSGTIWAQTAPATTTAAAAAPTTAPVMPSDLVDITKNPTINPINTTWTLVAAFLVFAMQAGFTMLEAGFCRSRETVNVLVECVFDTCLCGFLYYTWGYAFMFGQGNGLIGWHDPTDMPATGFHNWFFLQNITAFTTYGGTGVPVLAHWVFQFAFADCASTICSGTMIGRTGFIGDIIYSVGVSGFIYPIIGHWAWGPDGILATMGGQNAPAYPERFTNLFTGFGMNFHDFAGSTVVHSIGGWIALAGGIMLGPRLGRKFKKDGGGPMLPHDLVVGVIGGFLLWFGWYGFNPGSSLSAMDYGGIGRIACNTTLAACTGGLAAEFFIYFRIWKWDAAGMTNGFLAGLVAITCPCYWVSPSGACALGCDRGDRRDPGRRSSRILEDR
jgi:ammonium transporter, Amt family